MNVSEWNAGILLISGRPWEGNSSMINPLAVMFFVLAICPLFAALNSGEKEIRDKAYVMFMVSLASMFASQLLAYMME